MTEPVTGLRPAKVVAARPALFWLYVAACGLVGLAAVVTAAAHLTVGQMWAMGSPFALIAGLVLLAELRPVVTAGAYDAQGVTISTAFVFAILFYWGPWPRCSCTGSASCSASWPSASRCGRSSSTPASTSPASRSPRPCSGWPACGPRRTTRSATSRCTRRW